MQPVVQRVVSCIRGLRVKDNNGQNCSISIYSLLKYAHTSVTIKKTKTNKQIRTEKHKMNNEKWNTYTHSHIHVTEWQLGISVDKCCLMTFGKDEIIIDQFYIRVSR